MTDYPVPPNEAARNAALLALHILDTPPEIRFDRVTRLASSLFNVPIALITLIDSDRQWFKSCYGASFDTVPRAISFCAYTVLRSEALVVPDMAIDATFKDNPLVVGAPHIRFYAGQPLVIEGFAVGTLCLLDHVPGNLSPTQLELLKDLAAMVEAELKNVRFAQSVAEAYERERHLRVQYALTRILADSPAPPRALDAFLRTFCEGLNWDCGEYWEIDRASDVLRCTNFWRSESHDLVAFETQTRQLAFAPGEGLPGRAWQSGFPQFYSELNQAEHFVRAEVSTAAGFNSGFCFPVIDSGENIGVLGFFSRSRHEFDVTLMGLLEAFGQQLGQFFARKRAEDGVVQQNEELLALNDALEAQASALADSEARFRMLAENASDVIARHALDGRFEYVSPASFRLMGYRPQDLLGRSIVELVHPDDLPKFVGSSRRVSKGEVETESIVFRVQRQDGTYTWLESAIRAVKDGPDGAVTELIAVSRDVSSRKALESLKDQLVAVVSHDLKNPLGSLQMSLDMVVEDFGTGLPGEVMDMLNIAGKSVRRLIRMTETILDDERLMSGEIKLSLAPVAAPALIAEAVGGVKGLAAKAGVTVKAAPAPLVLNADGDRVLQVLVNLLGNAIKFSPRGGVVSVEAEKCNDMALVRVIDQGRGIPANKLELIFERFGQVEAADATLKGGTGLGLPICRVLVEQHGGRIWAESKPGEGSIFSFTLPLERQEVPL